MKKLVYICSPLKGDIENNIKRANTYCRRALEFDAIPLAPHTIFTQFLDDNVDSERKMGMLMGLKLLSLVDELWICGPYISQGMQVEIDLALHKGVKVVDMRDVLE